MGDLISRCELFNKLAPVQTLGEAYAVIQGMQTAPEVIRCKDCFWHGVCRFEQGLGLDGYCSKAERRTDG